MLIGLYLYGQIYSLYFITIAIQEKKDFFSKVCAYKIYTIGPGFRRPQILHLSNFDVEYLRPYLCKMDNAIKNGFVIFVFALFFEFKNKNKRPVRPGPGVGAGDGPGGEGRIGPFL